MARIVMNKNGITIDVPENQITSYLRLGYTKTGDEKPDAPPPGEEEFTPEAQAVADAAALVAEAQLALTEAENAYALARSGPAAEASGKGKG